MIRFVSIVIIASWGLVVQPLMASAMSVKMMTGSTHSSMIADNVDTSIHADRHYEDSSKIEDSSKAPCHEESVDKSSSEHCDKCGDNCSCTSSCVAGSSVAAVHKLPVNLDLNGRTFAITTNGSRIYGLPSRIFHPPKHA